MITLKWPQSKWKQAIFFLHDLRYWSNKCVSKSAFARFNCRGIVHFNNSTTIYLPVLHWHLFQLYVSFQFSHDIWGTDSLLLDCLLNDIPYRMFHLQ